MLRGHQEYRTYKVKAQRVKASSVLMIEGEPPVMLKFLVTYLAHQGYAHPLNDSDAWLWVHTYETRTGEKV